MTTGGWINGDIFLPFFQTLLTTCNDNLMLGSDTLSIEMYYPGQAQGCCKRKGTDAVCRMVKKAKKSGIPVHFVLFDTWFSNPAQLVELKSMEVDTIAVIKKNGTKYLWTSPETGEKAKLDVKEIYSRDQKEEGESRYLLSVSVMVVDGEGTESPQNLCKRGIIATVRTVSASYARIFL